MDMAGRALELKHGPPETWGWTRAMHEATGYRSPDAEYEGAALSLIPAGTRWLDLGCGRAPFPHNPRLCALLSARAGLLVGVDASAKSKFGGKGATSRADTLTGTISTIVTEVLPNGDLRIEGKREVTVNSETQLMSISGIVRRVDVDTKNTVLSSAIADAKIEYSGLGVVDDVQRPGWLVRVLDWVYPF